MPLVSWHETSAWQATSLAASGSPKFGSAESATEMTRSSRLPCPGPCPLRRAATCEPRGRSSAGLCVVGLAREPCWPGLSRGGGGNGRAAREQQRAARRGTAIPIVAVVQAAVVAARAVAKMAEPAASVGAARGRAA
eukprot:scaffold33865_cov50-Phaeocystis_antarctica.AAC.2